MPKRKIDHYLKQAEECRDQAARALREEDRQSWLKLAGKWQRMAEGTHQPAQQAQQPQGRLRDRAAGSLPRAAVRGEPTVGREPGLQSHSTAAEPDGNLRRTSR